MIVVLLGNFVGAHAQRNGFKMAFCSKNTLKDRLSVDWCFCIKSFFGTLLVASRFLSVKGASVHFF